MRRIFIPLATLVILMLTVHACDTDENTGGNGGITEKTITVKGLFSLTGNWSSLGLTSQAALDLATEDINAYLANKKATFKLAVSVADTKLETELAKTQFSKAKDEKVSFVIGPQSSAELAALKPLSDAADIIVISQSSTAGSLAIANDNIFRFCPSDKIEGLAMAATIAKKGFKGLVTVARDDAGNRGLQSSTGAAFAAKGGENTPIPPYLTTLTDYAEVISGIKDWGGTLIDKYGSAKVGIYLASFDEGAEIFKLAAAEPMLSNLKWFGGDGVALSTAFLTPAVAEFVIKTSFFAPAFGLPAANESKWKPLAARIKTKTGIEPDAFALAAYDAMWTIAYTIESNNGTTDDFAKLKSLFVAQANKYSGVVGAEDLDAAGDRATGTFDYFSVVKEGSTYVWKLVGKSDE
ncbi:MAG: ABC transporter substrate-binding protein [Saprospiraceae bacterium]